MLLNNSSILSQSTLCAKLPYLRLYKLRYGSFLTPVNGNVLLVYTASAVSPSLDLKRTHLDELPANYIGT